MLFNSILGVVHRLDQNFERWSWSLPPDLQKGVLTTNQAFIEAKKTGQNPTTTAQELANKIELFLNQNQIPLSVSTIGPYLNLSLNDDSLASLLQTKNLQQGIIKDEQTKILLEFVSPNIAKPLHAGHLRNLNLSDALRRFLSLKYPNLKTEVYWGDWGIQISTLIWAIKKLNVETDEIFKLNYQEQTLNFGVKKGFYIPEVIIDQNNYLKKLGDLHTEEDILKLTLLYIWATQQKEANKDLEIEIKKQFLELIDGDEHGLKILEIIRIISQESFVSQIAELNAFNDFKGDTLFTGDKIDYNFGESVYEKIATAIFTPFLDQHQIWQTEGKARYFDFEKMDWSGFELELIQKYSKLGRCYLISSDGYTTYAFRDICARIHWAGGQVGLPAINADLMITLTANEQKHHFEQFFAILHYLSQNSEFRKKFGDKVADKLTPPHLKHISYGFLTLPEGKMSTRKGNFLTATDLLNQVITQAKQVMLEKAGQKNTNQADIDYKAKVVGISAFKWYDLNRDPASDMVLDIPKILSFEGNTGVYQLYTIARLFSVIEKNQASSQIIQTINVEKLNPEEKLILSKLWTFGFVINQAIEQYKPHLLCTYLFELATMVNSWYGKHSVASETDLIRKQTMLMMCQKVIEVMQFGLSLLGIEVLEQM
jgi:arginyl-tRNA synthetase